VQQKSHQIVIIQLDQGRRQHFAPAQCFGSKPIRLKLESTAHENDNKGQNLKKGYG
jgi:hypothetical protein